MTCHSRLTDCDECTTLVGWDGTVGVDNAEDDACVMAKSIWEISVYSSQFFYEPKTARYKVVKVKRNNLIIQFSNNIISICERV